jgi:hypothetical protein
MVISDAATDNHSIKARGAMSSKGSGRAMQPFAPDPGPNFASGFAEWS